MIDLKNAPIGVFDSGIGGVTVMEDLVRRFPNEDFIFIADTAHCPYGSKTRAEIQALAKGCGLALVSRGVKAIVIACNTATANSSALRASVSLPVIGAIAPTAYLAAHTTKNGRIAILATTMTISLKAYEHELAHYDPAGKFTYFPLAEQDFVTRVEDGRVGTKEAAQAVSEALTMLKDKDIDTVILGCTHFPRLKREIQLALPAASLVTSGEAIASELAQVLKEKDLLRSTSHRGTITLLTTGDANYLKKQTAWFPFPASYGSIKTL